MALGHIHLRFAWQAWNLWHWAGSGGALGRAGARLVAGDRRPTLCGRRGTWRHPTSFRVAGVALGDIHLRSAWQAWHLVTSTLALGDIHVRFAWQVWHLATSTFVSRGRCGTWSHSPSFCVADVALMALGWLWWRAWARWGALGCRWRRPTLRGRRVTWRHPPSFRVAGVWHLVTFTFVSRGRGGTYGTGLRFAWQAWHLWYWAGSGGALGRAGARLVANDAAQLCVAVVALGDIHLRFAWLWHLSTSTCVLRGRRGTWSLPLWHLATSTLRFRVAGVALGDIHLRFAWQVCGTWSHSLSFRVARVARMVLGWLWWRAWARWGTLGRQWRRPTLRGRRGTWRHPASFCVAVALVYIHLRSAWLGHFHVSTWRHPPSFRVAGLELGHIHLIIVLRGRRGIYGTGLALVARLGALGRACSPVTRPNFAWQGWQAWHLATSIFVSRGRCCRCWFQ